MKYKTKSKRTSKEEPTESSCSKSPRVKAECPHLNLIYTHPLRLCTAAKLKKLCLCSTKYGYTVTANVVVVLGVCNTLIVFQFLYFPVLIFTFFSPIFSYSSFPLKVNVLFHPELMLFPALLHPQYIYLRLTLCTCMSFKP